jgi:hypothetical protein
MCQTIKNTTIQLHVVRVINGNETLLKKCGRALDGDRADE